MEGRAKRKNTAERSVRERKKPRRDEKLNDEANEVQEQCRHLYKSIIDARDPEDDAAFLCDIFLQLPSKRDFKDYYQIIKHPIALCDMEAKIDENKYASLAEFKSDVDLMAANAKKYNIKESLVYQYAVLIQKLAKAWKPRSVAEKEAPPKAAQGKAVLKLPGVAFGSRAGQPAESKIKAIRLKAVDKPAKKGTSAKSLVEAISNEETKKALDILDSDESIDPNELVKVEMFEDTFTWGPLHAAAYYGDVKVCQALVKRGANVELNDTWYSATPLGWAAFGDKDKVVRLLIEKYNAKKSAKNIHGQVPFDVVSDKSDRRWVGLLTGPYPGEKNAGVTPPKPKVEPPPPLPPAAAAPPPPPPQTTFKPSLQQSSNSFQPPRKKRGRPPKSETDIQLQRPTEEIDISTFDPTVFGEIFTEIRKHTDNQKRMYSEAFETLPDPDEYPEYYQQIDEPRCLSGIDEKMRKKAYTNLGEWMHDMELVFDNAMEFNEISSRIYKDAKLLKRLLYRLKEKTMAREGVPDSQDDEAMSISLAGLPFHEEDKPTKTRTLSNKARMHSVEPERQQVMTFPYMFAQNPMAAAAVAQLPFSLPPPMPMSTTMPPALPSAMAPPPPPAESLPAMLPPKDPTPSPRMDLKLPLTTASPEFYNLFNDDIHKVRLLDDLEVVAADPAEHFQMKLRGDQIGHSLAVPSQIESLRITPGLCDVLRTDSQRLSMTVQQGNHKLDMIDGGLGEQDEAPCWKSDKLSLGLNSFKIIITANVSRLDGPMQPEVRTQVYYLFVMQV